MEMNKLILIIYLLNKFCKMSHDSFFSSLQLVPLLKITYPFPKLASDGSFERESICAWNIVARFSNF